ncbi:MAG: hypothetical protein LBQ65_04525, partial [Tannerellaceae bacterium]|nr:hypothetical protein [Tannerellaceae bacterium]
MNKHLIISGLLLLAGSLSLNAQVLYNNGKIHVGGTTTTNALYIGGSMHVVGAGSITQTGKTVLTGDFVNDVTSGNVFGATRTGTFEFRGSDVQEIRGTANKATGFIAFPDNLIINNSHTSHLNTIVKITPTMSATIKNLSFTRGRLVLDSNSGTNGGQRVSVIAHLLAETGGAITYKHEQASKVNEGVVQVNLNLGDNWSTGRMAGFSPPFKHMYADYFFFNFLSRPTGSGFFSGSKDVWIHEPKTKLPAGTGYVLGQGLVPWDSSYYIETLNPSYSTAVRSEAAQTDYAFARTLVPTSLSSFVNAAFTDEYTGEELNTGNVAVTLSNLDYNYLGNPYTVPLDLTELVDDQAVPTLSTATWGAAASTLARRFYVLSAGTGTYLPNKEFAFTVSYLTAQRVGGTMTAPYHIAPMQMFAVQTTSSAQPSFTIPATKRTHGVAQFLRSDSNPVIDELLIETQDGQTGGFDRLCIVFRNNATL